MRSRQRGFIYLTTGANGTGKTLFTLKDVRDLQLKDGRPVYYTERFEALGPIKEFGWLPIKAEDWPKVEHPAIFVFDEAHKDFPLRGGSSKVPPHVLELAEHRRRGHDFFVNTHLPQKLDVEVRRLIGAPGWHRHMKVAGPSVVREHTYNFANPNADKPGAQEDAVSRTRIYPKEVYSWYKSAEQHTAKGKVPKALWVLLACVLAAPALFYVAVHNMAGKPAEMGKLIRGGDAAPASSPAAPVDRGGSRGGRSGPVLTTAEYVAARTPRLEAFPQTAPAYDQITEPKQAPYPAACVIGKMPAYAKGEDCRCWTQQATPLDVPADACRQIARKGFFMDWKPVEVAAVVPAAVAKAPDEPRPQAWVIGGQPTPVTSAAVSEARAEAPLTVVVPRGGASGVRR